MINLLKDKALITLVILLVVGTVLGYINKQAARQGHASLAQEITRGMVLPFSMGARGVMVAGEEIKDAARPRTMLLRENAELRKKVQELTLDNMQLRAKAYENINLRKELGFRQSSDRDMISAEVIGRRESAWFDTASINVGTNQGIEKSAAVVNHNGLIGQVLVANKFSSEIVALTNPGSAVGGMIERSRCAGIVQGGGFDYLIMAYLAKDADVKVGDIVVTSGMGKVIPKGFVIGRVAEVNRSQVSMTASAKVIPSVRFDQIEQVFVLHRGSPGVER